MLQVTERKTGKQGLANQLEDGRYSIDLGEGVTKELAESTFKRLYTVTGEVAATPNQQDAVETNDAPVETNETNNAPETPQPKEDEVSPEIKALDELLAGGEELNNEDGVTPTPEAGTPAPKPDKPEEPQRSVADLGLGIELLDWNMAGTRGGKTDRVSSQISIKGYLMEVTEYDGFITDVKLFAENPEAPENDPDAKYKLAYRSPKMSLKDTLAWLGLSEDDMKLARKEITAIRKAVKSAHLDTLAEQKEQDELQKLAEKTEGEPVNS
jgi:hypothetical protein